MNSQAKTPRPERDKTDESLRTERKNTDQAIAAKRLDNEVRDYASIEGVH